MKSITFKDLRGEYHENYSLARHTSWRVGGAAQRCFYPADLQDLQNFLRQLPVDEPITWLGLGSNVLIRDGGIAGTVILTLNRLKGLDLLADNTVRAESGVTCAKLSKFCVKQGFEDGAFFAGIPGTVGGALAMNAGAFGGETWNKVIAVETINRQGEVKRKTPADFKIQYRQVNGLQDEYFLSGFFQFSSGDSGRAKENISALLKKRNASQPIGTYSCGSVFRNPPQDFAARLIEATGLKGYRIGNAEVSNKHANFILNTGGASAQDIERLISFVADKVFEQHGVKLVREVHFIGEA